MNVLVGGQATVSSSAVSVSRTRGEQAKVLSLSRRALHKQLQDEAPG